MRGRLIVFEGLDGVGKTTLSERFALRLGAVWRSTPGAAFGDCREQLDRAFAADPIGAQLLYAASVSRASVEARGLLEAGHDVVMDRYWLSTLAYAPLRGAFVDLGAVEAGLLPADVTVFVDLDEELRRSRLVSRGVTLADRQTFQPGVAAGLRERFHRGFARPVAGQVLPCRSDRYAAPALVELLAHEIGLGAAAWRAVG